MTASGVRAVAALEVRDRLRTGLIRPAIGLMVFLGLALVVPSISGISSNRSVTFHYGVVGPMPAGLKAVMDPPAGIHVVYVAEPTAATAEHDVLAGRIDAALVDNRLVARSNANTTAGQLLSRGAARSAVVQRLEQAGVAEADAERTGLVSRPSTTLLSPISNKTRAATALVKTEEPIAGAVVFILITLAAGSIQEERGTRMADMLLVPLRPNEIVTGKVAGSALLAAIMAAAAAVPAAAFALAIHGLHIVGLAPATVAAAAVFLAMQFAVYGYAAAAGGATVAGLFESQLTLFPIAMTMTVGILLSHSVVTAHPDSVASTLISMFPPFTPMAMLTRTAAGHVPAWQIATSIMLTVAAAVWLARAAATTYLGAVMGSTTDRIKLRTAYRIGRAANRRRHPQTAH
jgi:ABC-2 type transport system permease protein